MRILSVDVGKRRIGLAISDRTQTLARPLSTLLVAADTGIDAVASEIARLSAEDDGLERIVVGLPMRLNGEASEQTEYVKAFIAALRPHTSLRVDVEDERLRSHEAESRLAVRERDW